MLEIIKSPERSKWKELTQRPYVDNAPVLKLVEEIYADVEKNGDEALRRFTKKFDGVELKELEIPRTEWETASHELSEKLKNSIQQAARNIELFHTIPQTKEEKVETMPGVFCWRKTIPIERIGLYIPGGTAPLFSTVLMLAIPARLAGCKEIFLCTPCDKEGKVHPAILFCAAITGVTRIFKVGGAQAICALAAGTESISPVYKIFGPGNQYVTAAKQLVQMKGTAIDLPAGPSEVCVLTDESTEPTFAAADLLSQAEHGSDSQVVLVSTNNKMMEAILAEVEKQLDRLPRKDMAAKALKKSRAVFYEKMEEAIAFVNAYAPEHLILSCANPEVIADQISNAGSVFLGKYSPESAGDYASGTNHTLPTNGFARAYSGVSVDSFTKKITYQQLTEEGLQHIGPVIITMAEAEGLEGHAAAVKVRMKNNEQGTRN